MLDVAQFLLRICQRLKADCFFLQNDSGKNCYSIVKFCGQTAINRSLEEPQTLVIMNNRRVCIVILMCDL